MPSYPLESPDHLRSAPQTLDIRPLQMNLPELDPRYHLHSSLDQPARLGSTPTSRKPPPPVLASAYEPYTPTDYHTSGVSSATFPSTYDFNPRLPSSPSTNLYRQLPPRHFASPVSAGLGPSCPEPVIGQKRRHLVSAPEHDYSPQRKRQAVSNPSPQLVHIPHAKESGHQRMTTVLCLHASGKDLHPSLFSVSLTDPLASLLHPQWLRNHTAKRSVFSARLHWCVSRDLTGISLNVTDRCSQCPS